MGNRRAWISVASILGALVVPAHASAQSSPPPLATSSAPASSPEPAASSSSPAPSSSPPPTTGADGVARVRVRFEAEEPGASLGEVSAFGRPVSVLCALPCTAAVPSDVTGPRRLVFRREHRGQVMVEPVRFHEGDQVHLHYVNNWRWRVAGGVVMGAHAIALTVLLSVLIVNHFDFTLGERGSEPGGLGFVYGFATGIFIGVPLAMLMTTDQAAVRRAPASTAP